MNLKMVLLCSFYRWQGRGSSQRHWVAWPKSTQAASASAKLWTWFLWVQVQASSCHALITSSETYQILLGHSSWILALSQIQCKRPGRANSVVTVWSLAGSWPRKSQYFSSSPKTGKNQCPSLKAFSYLGESQAFCPTSWMRHTHNRGDLFYWVYHFISFKYLFIYLAASGLSWCTRDLYCIMRDLSLSGCAHRFQRVRAQ